MNPPVRSTAKHFQQEVADLLKLPPESGDAEVRKALLAKGPDFIRWYDTRLRAIAESRQPEYRTLQTHRTARRVDRHH